MTRTALVVDGSRTIRRISRRTLEGFGLACREARIMKPSGAGTALGKPRNIGSRDER